MILQCAECRARYLVPDQAIGATGRTVRCARCAHTWFEAAAERASAPLADLDQMVEQINATPKPIPAGSNLPVVQKQRASWLLITATLTAGMAAAMLALLLGMPRVFGLPSTQGLMLGGISIVKDADEKHTSYQINGKIHNTMPIAMKVPTLRITLVDEDGKSLQYWDFGGDIKTIQPLQSIPFTTNDLELHFSKGSRFVVELGNALELGLRRKPGKLSPPPPAPAS